MLMALLLGCGNKSAQTPKRGGDTVRYRLLLRDNPVNPAEASRCYGSCQSARTPKAYVECLSACPGFETTPGEYCSNTEVPPVAACLTARKIPLGKETPPGLVVLAVVGQFALVVGAAALCNVSSSQCGSQLPPPY